MVLRVLLLASLVVCCLGAYPKSMVYFRDPETHDGVYKCCKGSVTEHLRFGGNFQLEALVVASRLDDQGGSYQEDVQLLLARNYGESYHRIAAGNFSGAVLPGQNVIVPMKTVDWGDTPVVETGVDYFVEVGYSHPGDYPLYTAREWDILGPVSNSSAQLGFVIGLHYSKP